jgi:hypothetical protein
MYHHTYETTTHKCFFDIPFYALSVSNFMTPGWTYHWRRMFEREFGNPTPKMAKMLFKHYEPSLLIQTPIMCLEEMKRNTEDFNEMFWFRTEVCEGGNRISV